MDPYRLLFPLGTLMAILGTASWIGFGFGWSASYPGAYHPELMTGGFLFAFSAGFLMTAVPQFTGSTRCRPWELAAAVAFFVLLSTVGFRQDRTAFHALSCLSLGFLAVYCVRRVLSRTYAPPPFFVFVGLGLAMGIVGALLLALEVWIPFAKLIYTQGMILSLILGVGTHLLPAIWGWTNLPIQITKLDETDGRAGVIAMAAGLAAVLLGSFVVELGVSARAAWVLRAVLVSYLSVTRWKIFKRPVARGRLVFWLWISAWALVVGLWAPVAFPVYAVDGLHVAFIGGFGLMTLLVASRVTLAHGDYGHRVELRSRLLVASALLILASAATRALAPLLPAMYLHHLAYAAATWIVGVLLWAAVFVPKMIRLSG